MGEAPTPTAPPIRRVRDSAARVMKLLAEEAPSAYKDVNEVIDVCLRTGLGAKVVRLRPLGIVKG